MHVFFHFSVVVSHHICCGAVSSIMPSSEKEIKQFSLILGELHSLLWQSDDWAVNFPVFLWPCRPQDASTPLRHQGKLALFALPQKKNKCSRLFLCTDALIFGIPNICSLCLAPHCFHFFTYMNHASNAQ